MARRVHLVLIAAAAVGMAASPASDLRPNQFCREGARTGAAKSYLYAVRSAGSYCDGTLEEKHAAPGQLPVIGVTAAPIKGDPSTATLQIGVVNRSIAALTWPLQVQGLAKAPDVNYRFDAALSSPSQPLRIGSESAMTKLEKPLRAEDVAWAAWSDTKNSGRIFVPVIPSGASAGDVEITVRPSGLASYVVYSVRSETGETLLEDDVEGNDKPAEPIRFTIPRGDPPLIQVQVTSIGSDGKKQTAGLRLVRPGPPKK